MALSSPLLFDSFGEDSMGRRSLFQFVVFDVYFPWSPRVAHEGFILANLGEPLFQTLIPLGVSGFNVQQRPRKRERDEPGSQDIGCYLMTNQFTEDS